MLFYPDIMIARHQGFLTGQILEKLEAGRELIARTLVAGKHKQVGRIGPQEIRQQTGRFVAAFAYAQVKVGRDCQA